MSQQPIIGVVGVGYVGLVTAACFAELGNTVVCRDILPERVADLSAGRIPFYEPGLADVVLRNRGRLSFTIDIRGVTEKADIIFVCVPTPSMYSGDADLSYVESVINELPDDTGDVVLVMKSTVPVGTGGRMRELLDRRNLHHVKYVSNPEFLKEGDAIADFMQPDRVVIGGEEDGAIDRVAALHRPLETRIVRTDVSTAEMIKYASNAFLATKISFINEIANVCEETGADVQVVAEGMGLDKRIGPHFLRAGIGFGGSCLVGTETVLVRDLDGDVRLYELQQLAEEMGLESEGAVHPEGLEVLAWRVGERAPEYLPLEAVTRRRYEGDIVHVRTKMGRRVSCTEDHPFVARAGVDEEVGVVLAGDLEELHWLPLSQGAPDFVQRGRSFETLEAVESAGITPADVIVRPASRFLDEVSVDELTSLGHPRGRARAHDIKRAGSLRLAEADVLEIPLEDAVVSTSRSGTYVPAALADNPRFWRTVGLYLAEGNVSIEGDRHRLYWSFHPSKEEHLVQEIAEFWRSVGVEPTVHQAATSRQVILSSRILGRWWLDVLEAGRTCYDHRIPEAAWNTSAESKLALLSGLWHGDGSWSLICGGPSVVLEYGTVSRPLADGMLRLLGEFGVVSRLKVGRTAKSTVDTYWLVVSGADQVERLLSLVRPSDVPQIIHSIASQKRRIAPTGYRRADGAAWVRVTSVEREPWSGDVFSVEVPDAGTFVTTGGLVVHNCFPKDVSALKQLAGNSGYHFQLLNAVIEVNELQKRRLVGKLVKHLGPLRGRTITLLGLAFKPGTDDMREAASLVVSSRLMAEGATVRAHDPIAAEAAKPLLPGVEIFDDVLEAVRDADAVVLVTEWPQYAELHLSEMAKVMRNAVLVDGRNLFSPAQAAAAGFAYESVGRPGSTVGTPKRRQTDRRPGETPAEVERQS